MPRKLSITFCDMLASFSVSSQIDPAVRDGLAQQGERFFAPTEPFQYIGETGTRSEYGRVELGCLPQRSLGTGEVTRSRQEST